MTKKNANNLKIVTNGWIGHVFVDGVEIKHCKSYEIKHTAGGLPTVLIEIAPLEIEVECSECIVKEI